MALAIVVLTAAAGSAATAARDAATVPSADAKKKCKIVKKRVHGHIKRVRVCTKPTVVKSVSLKLDTGHAVSKPIAAADGGTVTATAAGGAKLTLTIPKDALLTDKTVTMTPVTSVAGLPKGSRFLGGVQLAPEGTALGKGATLTVETPAAGSAKHLRAIGWQGTGKTPFTYAAARTGSTVRIKVAHFSGYGVEDGSVIPPTGLEIYLRGQYPRIHRQMVQATTTDSVSFGRQAIQDWLGWDAGAAYAPENFMGEEREELRHVLLPKVIRNAIEKSYERCRTRHDAADELLFLRTIQRQAQLLGLDDLSGLVDEKYQKCASFELDFESVITWAINGTVRSHVRVQALELNASNNHTNSTTLEYLSFEFLPEIGHEDDCTIQTSTQPLEEFGASIVTLEGNDPPGEAGNKPKLVVNIFSGGASETINDVCPDGTHALPLGHWWQEGFKGLHQGQSFTINDWEYVGRSLFARKTYSRTGNVGGGQVTEQTTFDLRHTPQ